MMIAEVFGSLRKTASALERDCLELRSRVEETTPGASGANVLGCIGTITQEAAAMHATARALPRTDPMAALLEVCTTVFASNNGRLDAVEAHLEQYGYARPEGAAAPVVAAAAAPEPSPVDQSAEALDDTGFDLVLSLRREGTFTQEEDETEDHTKDNLEPRDGEPRSLGDEPAAAAPAPEEMEEEAPAEAPEDELDALLNGDDMALPSLADLGFSAATLAMLSQDGPSAAVTASATAAYTAVATPAKSGIAQYAPKTPGTVQRPYMAAIDDAADADADADDTVESIDLTTFGITSVAVLGAASATKPPRSKTYTSDLSAAQPPPRRSTFTVENDGGTTTAAPAASGEPDLFIHPEEYDAPSTAAQLDAPSAPSPEFDMDMTFEAPISSAIPTAAAVAAAEMCEPEPEPEPEPAASLSGDGDDPFYAVSEQDYSSMPHFVTLTLSLEELNAALGMIKDCILATDAPAHEVIFTQSQLRDELNLGMKAKPILLILLKLQRLEGHGKSDTGDAMYSFKC